jgi:hypothetical protein
VFRREFLKFVALTSASLVFTAEDATSGTQYPTTSVRNGNGTYLLSNEYIEARLNKRGLTSLTDKTHRHTLTFDDDTGSITVGDDTLDTAHRDPVRVEKERNSFVYVYAIGGRKLKVAYELRPGWHFVTKQLIFDPEEPETAVQVRHVGVMHAAMRDPLVETFAIDKGTRGAFLDVQDASSQNGHGVLLTLQNPMIDWRLDHGAAALSYAAEMEWKASYGPFQSDRAIIAPYQRSGVEYRAASLPERQYFPDPASVRRSGRKLDMAQIDCFANCVRPWMIAPPAGTSSIHVGWTENDFQIDIGTAAGRTEYKRIIDRVSQLDVRHVLFAPANSQVSSVSENTDAWGWENVLWFGLGQKIRKGEWVPGKDPLPSSITEMLDYARQRGVKLVAYVYPSLGFMQNPAWTRWCGNKPSGYRGADSGVRSFQDWFVDQLVAFHKQTGCGGFSFDYWWIAYDKPASSKYAQWHGCRRILETLKRRLPDILIDGRQQYYQFGPWTWVSGSYAHPFGGDEQPESYTVHPDLHTDRVSAFHQRMASWNYRMGGWHDFNPVELTAGFTTHQTQRFDAHGKMHRDAFRIRDWDYLGWRYSVLSSIATGPANNVVNMLPARDIDEFRSFSAQDIAWYKKWLAWTNANLRYVRRMRPIIGQPLLGCIDGCSAIDSDTGYLFLFNPNYRKMDAEFTLDESIGIHNRRTLLLREIEPEEGKNIGKPGAGFWEYGDAVRIPMEGASAVVLRVEPAEPARCPSLFNTVGMATLAEGTLQITGARGEIGSTIDLLALVASREKVRTMTVNGRHVQFHRSGDAVTARVSFAGTPFGRCHQVGTYHPDFHGTAFHGKFVIPGRIFAQLAERKKAWPVPYTPEDLLATWLGPERLLLFVNIADPNPEMAVAMKINGRPMEVEGAWNGIYPNSGKQTFVGFYADVLSLQPETPYDVELQLPDQLRPGQFQGLYFDNVETEYTEVVL